MTTNHIITAWEKYAGEDFTALIELPAEDRELEILAGLAHLELGNDVPELPLAGSRFAHLARGMLAFHSGDYQEAGEELFTHLHEKEYFSDFILDRFLRAAEASESYHNLYAIATKYSSWPNYQEKLAGPLFYSAYALQKYAEALKVFEKNHALLATTDALFKVAYSLIALKEYKRAEGLLLKLYEKLTGKSYTADIKALEETYAPLIPRLPELTRKKLNQKEAWQVGMACIVNRDYDKALSIFKTLLAA